MPEKDNPPGVEDAKERLKWQTARELGLDDDLKDPDELSVREAGKIGGNMVRKLVKKGEESMAEEQVSQRALAREDPKL